MTNSALFPEPLLSPPNSSPSLNINHSSLLIQMFLLLKIDAAHKSDLNSCTFLQFPTIVIVIKNHRSSSSSGEFDEFFIFNISHSSLCVLFFVLFVQFICVIQQFFIVHFHTFPFKFNVRLQFTRAIVSMALDCFSLLNSLEFENLKIDSIQRRKYNREKGRYRRHRGWESYSK